MTNAYSGVAYSMTFASTGGLAPLAWSATGLPVGLSLDALTGVVSGTVVAGDEGDYTVRVTATDNNSPADSDTFVYYFGVYVVGETPLSIVETSMPTGDVGDFYSFTFTAAGGSGTYEWIGVNGLPSGMDAEFDSATGEVTVSGEPLNGGTFYVNVQVIDSNSEVTSQMYTFVVSESSSSSSSSGGNSAPVQAVPNLVGGGCSVNGSGSFNVVLALMALVLAGAVVGRRMMLPIGSRS